MALIKDTMDTIEQGTDYVTGSLIIKSFDDRGVVLKWLEDNGLGSADRKQKFITLDESEALTIPKIEERTAVSEIMVSEAQ